MGRLLRNDVLGGPEGEAGLSGDDTADPEQSFCAGGRSGTGHLSEFGEMMFNVFGKAPAGQRLERMRRSPNYKRDRFENRVPTDVILKDASFFKMLSEYRNRPANTAPPAALPSVITDLRALPDKGVWVVWFGHSSYLLKIEGVTILVDPVFSGNASPVSFFAKAFAGTQTYGVKEMTAIDILLLTHDHYDHLDYPTVKVLAQKAGRV